jgi:hypothetical protein
MLAVPVGKVAADSWLPAQVETYFSDDKKIRVTITPRDLASNLAYFEDKVEEREPAGQKPGGVDKANMVLERKQASGKWQILWQRPLLNDVAPVSTLISKSGKYVVTFDNWHSMGHGDNVVVIYGPDGKLIRSMALSDFLPKEYISALPGSVSSLHWSGKHRISADEEALTLEVRFPGSDFSTKKERFVDVSFGLATGKELPIEPEIWDNAMDAAKAHDQQRRERNRQRREYLIQPLLGPKVSTDGNWHEYLREAFARGTRDWEEDSTWTTVLRLPSAKDYKPSRKWISEVLDEDWQDNIAFASHSQPHLVEVLKEEAIRFHKGKLAHLTLYLALSDANWAEAAKALEPTGAKLVQLNPEKPIVQNPERLKKLLSYNKEE